MGKEKSGHKNLKAPHISVIIPAYNAASTLGDCLEALGKQSYPHDEYEVIVVNDGSTDNTGSLADSAGVRVIHQVNHGPAAARNKGAKEASGDYLLFTDADCAPAPDWIERMMEAFFDSNVVGAKGVYRTYQRRLISRFVQCEYEDKYDRPAHKRRIDFIDTYSAAYLRGTFIQNGGFDPIFSSASVEDQEFSFRLAQKGYQMVFKSTAVVYHQHDKTLVEYARRKFNIGYWKALLIRWHPDKIAHDSHTPQTLKAQILLLGLIGMMLATWPFFPSYGGWGILICALVFVATAIPFSIKILRRDPKVLPVVFPALIVRAAALGAGLVAGFTHFAAQPTSHRPVISLINQVVKRLMDIVGATVGLIFSAPIVAVVSILIKLDSPGPVFYTQTRIGENGRAFRIIKLRSMVEDAERLLPHLQDLDRMESPAFKIKNDPRVTRVGRFLRRSSLDEIPQFWNILKGEMSLVGPRPEEVTLVQKYNDWHRRRLAVKPGLTGPMQVNGRGDLSLDERVRLELEYIENYSLWNDLNILVHTIPAVIHGTGAW